VQSACPELLEDVRDRAAAPDEHADARGRKCLVGIRAAIARQHRLHALFHHQLSRLDPRASAKRRIGVFDNLEARVVCVDHEEARTASGPRIDAGGQ